MAVDAHVEALHRRHAALEDEIREITAAPSVDPLKMSRLKREKLRIKDEIERLKNGSMAHSA